MVDVQEKLTPLVLNSAALVSRCEWLLRLARDLNVPLVISEQYPRGLGKTVATLLTAATPEQCVEKVHFSCYREPSFVTHWQHNHSCALCCYCCGDGCCGGLFEMDGVVVDGDWYSPHLDDRNVVVFVAFAPPFVAVIQQWHNVMSNVLI